MLDDPPRLHHVYDDPHERADLAGVNAERVATLREVAESWPRGERERTSVLGLLLDPDTFGGPEDRPPWADVARERAETAR